MDGQKLAQLIGNRQKLQTGATSQNFSRQIPQYFPASKVHNRTVPLCSLDKTDLQVLTQQEEKIIKLLKDAPKNLMELEAESKMENTVSLLEILSTMELEGLITLQNGFYAID